MDFVTGDGAVLLFFYFLVIAPVLGIILLGLLFVGIKHANRTKVWRIAVLVTVILVLPELYVVLLNSPVSDKVGNVRLKLWTHHLEQAKAYEGIEFPAGSTVTLNPDLPHELISATLSKPTDIDGMSLIGYVKFMHDKFAKNRDEIEQSHKSVFDYMYVGEGTLSKPAKVYGLPCAEGHFVIVATTRLVMKVRCVLGENYDVKIGEFKSSIPAGIYELQAGQPAGVWVEWPGIEWPDGVSKDSSTCEGTLAKPVASDVLILPAGTRMNDDAYGGNLTFVLPEKSSQTIQGLDITGTCGVEVAGTIITVNQREGCVLTLHGKPYEGGIGRICLKDRTADWSVICDR